MPETSTAASVCRLRKLWCIRINDLNTYNPFPEKGKKEDNLVPSPSQIPKDWLGKWGSKKDLTWICLESGDLFILGGEPSNELLKLLQEICPNGSALCLQYMIQESLYCREIISRIRDPFCSVEPLESVESNIFCAQ